MNKFTSTSKLYIYYIEEWYETNVMLKVINHFHLFHERTKRTGWVKTRRSLFKTYKSSLWRRWSLKIIRFVREKDVSPIKKCQENASGNNG